MKKRDVKKRNARRKKEKEKRWGSGKTWNANSPEGIPFHIPRLR